ncbi:sulfatase [Tautonia marina]|uniref:sulfatase n=1 Tax=Tautonia marina TaxID=2653855 RepID=UPI001260E2D8|nr:sulfatase [Tautonia marina]
MSSSLPLMLAALLATSAIEPDDSKPERPNVLFLAIDDLNDWVGCLQGHPQIQTPNIDRLARRGTLFTNAHTQSPLCNPSRTSILTGLRPSTTGIYGLAPWFRTVEEFADVVSLPQHFRNHGYTALSTGKIYHGGYPPAPDRPREFDTYGTPSAVGARPAQKLISPTPVGNHPLMDWGTFPHRDEDKGDYQVASWAVEQLESGIDDPFFLAVGFFLPHVPCYATQQWFDLYPDESLIMPRVFRGDRLDTPEFSWYLHWSLPEPRLSWMEANGHWRSLVQSYLASISFVDSQVGRVLDALDASGHGDDTVIVLWSDHGYHLGEKEISGKNTLWEPSTRVPLIVAGPGVPEDQRCDRPVELLDLFPTLIDLCDLSPRPGLPLEGHSLVPLINDPAADRAWPAITTHNQGNHGIRTDRWRFIRYADGSEELYDLEVDPEEWTNLALDPTYEPILAEHRRWLPTVDRPPAPGSQHRVLTFDGTTAIWEGAPILPSEKMP